MKMLLRSAAVAAAFTGFMSLSAVSASAVTIDFGTQPGNFSPYVEDGFAFDLTNLTNGQCPAPASCLLLNNGANDETTLTAVGGGTFDLLGFSFHFIGDTQQQRGVLTVTDTATLVFTQAAFGNDPFDVTFTDEFLGVSAITFSYSGPGTGRLDDVIANGTSAVIPLPASLPLLLAGLAGLGFIGRRRRAA